MSLYDLIVRSVDSWSRRAGIRSVKTHSVYLRAVPPGSVVVDLGANIGEFTEAMGQFGCECYAIEAMPDLFSQIRAGERIRKFNVAIAEREGPLRFFVSKNRECNSIYSGVAAQYEIHDYVECPGIPLERFLEENRITTIDLLKVDIEGAEGQLFRSTSDATLSKISQITIEFHDFIPETISPDEVRQIRQRLERLGFYCLPFSFLFPHQATRDFLFVNLQACRVSRRDRVRFAAIHALLKVQQLKARLKPQAIPST